MKRKIVSIAIVLCLAITAIAGATLAYFTDTDTDVNVMVSGNVEIVQNETDRYGDPYAMYDIFDNKQDIDESSETFPPMLLVPAVYLKANEEGKMMPYNPATTAEGPEGGATGEYCSPEDPDYPDGSTMMNMYDDNINNEIDKVISVTNTGTLPVYVRTIVLIENAKDENGNELTDKLHIAYTDENDGVSREWIDEIIIDDQSCEAFVFTYEDVLEPDATTKASMKQIWLDPMAENKWYDFLGEDGMLTIIAFSQAVQSQGFAEYDYSADVALDTAFGEPTQENFDIWFSEDSDLTVKTTGLYNAVGGEENPLPEN